MRIFRIVAIVAAAFIALVFLGAISVLLFVDPNRYRGDIERAARDHTGRPLTIDGKLGLKLFPWLALSVEDIKVGNPPGYGPTPFIIAHSASIGVKLLPLLAKRLEVSRISVDGLTAHLISRGDENNWKDLNESKESKPGTPPADTGSPAAASIEGIDITQAELIYDDEAKKTTTRIGTLNIRTGRLTTGGARSVIEKLAIDGTYESTMPGSAPADAAKPLAFSLTTTQVALDNEAHTLAPATIEAKLGDLDLTVVVAGEKLSTDRVLTGTITLPKTSPRGLMRSAGMTPPVTRDSQALSALALKTQFRLTQKAVQLIGLDLTLDDTRIDGTAGIEDLDTMALAFNLNMNGINVDRYRSPADTQPHQPRKATPGAVAAPTPLPLASLRKIDAQGTLRIGTATFAGLSFTNMTLPLMAKDGHIHLGPTKAGLYGGEYNGDIVLDARPVQATLSLNEHVRATDIGALVKAAYASSKISGRADVNVAVAGVGNTTEAIVRSLAGKIDANVKQGALNGVDVTYELQSATALLNRQAPAPRAAGPARTVFNSLLTTATLDKGVLHDDDLKIETDFLKVHGGGTLDLTTEALDYRLVAGFYKVPPAQANRAAGPGTVALDKIEVPLVITGTVSNPTVRPDLEALAKGQLRQEVQKKAGDLLKGKLGDKLKDLLGH